MRSLLLSFVLAVTATASPPSIPRSSVRSVTPIGEMLVIRTATTTFVAEAATVTLEPSGDLSLGGSFIATTGAGQPRRMSARVVDKEGTEYVIDIPCVDSQGRDISADLCQKILREFVKALRTGLKVDGLL